MVCNRCILVVKQELEKLNLAFNSIVLGELQLKKEPTVKQLAQLKTSVANIGFEVLDDSKKQLIEPLKNISSTKKLRKLKK